MPSVRAMRLARWAEANWNAIGDLGFNALGAGDEAREESVRNGVSPAEKRFNALGAGDEAREAAMMTARMCV